MTFYVRCGETFQLRGDDLHNALGQHKNLTRLRAKDKKIPRHTHTYKGYLCVCAYIIYGEGRQINVRKR